MKQVFLIGYMGAGKTSVGKVLAKLTNLTFIDLDSYIESRYRRTVRQLFEEKGEGGFREMEQKLLHEVAAFEDVLISTGGGAPCYFDNMAFMNKMGTTIYLKVSVEELASRLEVCKQTRPIIKGLVGEELKAFVAKSLIEREAFYNSADIIFDAEEMLTDKDVHSIAERLAQIVEKVE